MTPRLVFSPISSMNRHGLALCLLCLLPACSSIGAPKFTGIPMEIVNTVDEINIVRASFNGHGIGGGRGGGQSCCIPIPAQWQPGLTATIAWTKDPSPGVNPGGVRPPPPGKYGSLTDEGEKWYAVHRANYTQHEVTMPLPKYGATCGLTVVFLPCDEVRPLIDCDEKRRVFAGTMYLPRKESKALIEQRLGAKQQCQRN